VTSAGSPDDTPVAGDPAFSDSSTVDVTHVTIDGYAPGEGSVTVALGPVGTWTTVAFGVSARLESDGSVTFTGVQEGDQYGITTASDFNAFAVTSLPAGVGPVGGQSSTNSFDLGIFSIGQVDTGDPIDISLDLQITDADGDTVVMPGAIDITFEPAVDGLAATSTSSQEAEFQKVAANSNTTLLAAAVAAAGLSSTQAAASAPADQDMASSSVDYMSLARGHQLNAANDGLSEARFVAAHELPDAASDVAVQAVSSRGADAAARGLDVAADQMAAPAQNAPAADQGPAEAAAAGPVAPVVAMASAEAFAAAGLAGDGKAAASVQAVIAEALGDGGAANVDGLLDALGAHGGGAIGAMADGASPMGGGVPAWDMSGTGAFVPGADMMFKMGAEMLHHDAVQPVVNG
jgi:hypothetical protein